MNHPKWLAQPFEGPKSSKSIRASRKVSLPSSWKQKDCLVLALNQPKHWSCASYMHPEVVHPNFHWKITLVPMQDKHESLIEKTPPINYFTRVCSINQASSPRRRANYLCIAFLQVKRVTPVEVMDEVRNHSRMVVVKADPREAPDMIFESWWDVSCEASSWFWTGWLCFFGDSISVPLNKSMKSLNKKTKQSHVPITTAKPLPSAKKTILSISILVYIHRSRWVVIFHQSAKIWNTRNPPISESHKQPFSLMLPASLWSGWIDNKKSRSVRYQDIRFSKVNKRRHSAEDNLVVWLAWNWGWPRKNLFQKSRIRLNLKALGPQPPSK